MKILAIENESRGINWSDQKEILKTEASAVYELIKEGLIREIYFNENKNAVLILECESMSKAIELLDLLPLVKKGLITFKVMELNPYTGFDRIIEDVLKC